MGVYYFQLSSFVKKKAEISVFGEIYLNRMAMGDISICEYEPQILSVESKMIDENLLLILACPKCKGPVKKGGEFEELVCEKCALGYPVRDSIPVMIVEEARRREELLEQKSGD